MMSATLVMSVVLAYGVTGGGAAAPVLMELHPVESKLIERTNFERMRHGLHPLSIDHSLVQSARTHASWMARSHVLQHTTAAVAENIAHGQNSTSQVVKDWLNSPGHRANMLSANYNRIGVAAYRGSNGTIYWCQQFLR